MEETDQELKDLLHYLNLPGALWVPVRVRALPCQDSGRLRRRYVVFAGPAHEERCASGDPQPSSAEIVMPDMEVRRIAGCRAGGGLARKREPSPKPAR